MSSVKRVIWLHVGSFVNVNQGGSDASVLHMKPLEEANGSVVAFILPPPDNNTTRMFHSCSVAADQLIS